jgi:tetratricopeptide (TPR) repeat protein
MNDANSPAKELFDKAFDLYLDNRYSQAKKVLSENIALFPDHARSHLLLGQIHFFSQEPDYNAALEKFREVVRIDPSWQEGHHWLGATLEQVDNVNAAIESYGEAIRLAPDDSRPHVALGTCFLRTDRYGEAIKMFRSGLELKPYCTEADVRVMLAEALQKNNQIEDACVEWQRVLELEPGWPSDDAPHKEAKRMLAKHCRKS